MTLVVYADFDSPESYLASRRASALLVAGVPVDWRAIRIGPAWPATGARMTPQEQEASARRLDELDALLLPGETLPRLRPTWAPNTEAAVSVLAEAYGTAVADEVRRLLFELHWLQGVDIGDPNALRTPLAGAMLRAGAGADPMRQTGFAVGASRGPITTRAYRRINAWQDEWRRLGRPALPVVLVDGATLVGLDAVRRLGKEIVYRGADPDPELPEPRRYPAVQGRPPLTWVSWVGGRWRFAYEPAS